MAWSYQYKRRLLGSIARAPDAGGGNGGGLDHQAWPPNLSRREACRYLEEKHGLKFQEGTLAKWFSVKSDGPPAYKNGRFPLYPTVELDAWARRRLGELRTSTSDDRRANERRASAQHRDDRAA